MKDVVYIGRHSRYDTSEEEGKGGILTDAGKTEAVQKMLSYIISVFTDEELKNTRFLFVASPTSWKNNPKLGRRAVETSVIYRRAINKYLKNNCGMTQSEIRTCFMEDDCQDAMIVPTMQKLIEEPNFWVEAPEFVKKLEKECGGRTAKFWNRLATVADEEIKVYGEHVESSRDVARRMIKAFSMARQWGAAQEGVNTCVIMISHGETLQPFYDGMGFDFAKTGYNEGIVIEADGREKDDKVRIYDASFKKKEKNVDLGKSIGEKK